MRQVLALSKDGFKRLGITQDLATFDQLEGRERTAYAIAIAIDIWVRLDFWARFQCGQATP